MAKEKKTKTVYLFKKVVTEEILKIKVCVENDTDLKDFLESLKNGNTIDIGSNNITSFDYSINESYIEDFEKDYRVFDDKMNFLFHI